MKSPIWWTVSPTDILLGKILNLKIACESFFKVIHYNRFGEGKTQDHNQHQFDNLFEVYDQHLQESEQSELQTK